MIRFETWIGHLASNEIEEVQSNDPAFFNVASKVYTNEINDILQHGVHYGFIKILVDGEELFPTYDVQIVQPQWLAYIDGLEKFLQTGYVKLNGPNNLELKRIDENTLSFKMNESLYVFSYNEFTERLVMAAIYYFELYEEVTNDNLYRDVVRHLKVMKSQLYNKS